MATGRSRNGWSATRRPVARAQEVLSDVRASESYDTTTLPVLLRELKNLV